MAQVLTEEQTMLKDTAYGFFQENAPVTALRKLRDEKDETGFSRDLWKEMANLGFAGVAFPEEFGGAGFGYFGLGLVMEEAGKTLAATPLVSTVLLGGSAVLLGGSDAQKADILPQVAAGDLILALAHEESAHHKPYNVKARAEKSGDGYTLSGEKTFVLDGHVADKLIVVARTSEAPGDRDGLTLFLVDGDAKGVSRQRLAMVDSRNSSRVELDGVTVGADAVIGEVDRGADVLDAVLDRARICLSAEMLGGTDAIFEMTLEYLKTRKQFGVLIGTFQALKHRAAELFSEIELCKSVVLEALTAIDEDANNVSMLASLAKARLAETYNLATREGVQMHGGIGMTDEHDAGLYMKRARVAEAMFGNARYHRDRFASLNGF